MANRIREALVGLVDEDDPKELLKMKEYLVLNISEDNAFDGKDNRTAAPALNAILARNTLKISSEAPT